MSEQGYLIKTLPHKDLGGRYAVSNMGEVINTTTGEKVRLWKNDRGYMVARLWTVNKQRTSKRVSRLVAEMFVPNPENKPQVDHIDNVRTNNRASNLQWLTASENVRKGWASGRVHHAKGKYTAKIRTFYITHENIELLKSVRNKSKFINELIAKHLKDPQL